MTDRLAFNIRPAGVGIIILQMSMALASSQPVELFVPDENHICYALKRIFKIDDGTMIISVGKTDQDNDVQSDELSAYVPYFHRNNIELFGKQYLTTRKKKFCVALAMHHGSGLGEDLKIKSMPYNKYATAEEYSEIFIMLVRAGYEVITMNTRELSIEHKILLMNEMCEFVIGYEGGLAHIAHLLRIPCIILPWKYNDMGYPGVEPGLTYEIHRFHVDRRTWFAKDGINEIMSWSPQQIDNIVNQLYNEQGNNIVFDSDVVFDAESLSIKKTSTGRDLTPRISQRDKDVIRRIVRHINPLKN